MNVEVCIKDNVFTSNVTSIICTDIYIACNGICFPSNDWNDFTDNLLRTWAHVMLEKRYKQYQTTEEHCVLTNHPASILIFSPT